MQFTTQARRGRRRFVAALAAGALVPLALATGGLAATASAAPQNAAAAPEPSTDPVSLVNQYIGTENEGFDFPAAGAPFGLAQQTPLVRNTPGAGGNRCDSMAAAQIYGFSQNTINGCRFNYLPVMPTTGAITSTKPADYASPFTRSTESAKPDEYAVTLDKYGVGAEVTGTTRTGWQRYTFPKTTSANVLFNTGEGVSSSEVRVVGDRTIEGFVQGGKSREYFSAQFSRPFSAFGTWKGSAITAGSRDSAASGSNGGYVSFDTTTDDSPVVTKIGLSFTGVEGARKNLATETDAVGFDYDAVQQNLRDQWNTLLGKAKVAGGTAEQQTIYYTALYHSLLDPNVVGDVDGGYMGYDGTVRKATTFTPYSNFSIWDTYRTQNKLIELLAPQVARDIDLSVLEVAKQQGWLPRWFTGIKEDNIMTGDPVTPYIVEGWSKGLFTPEEAEEAYQIVKKNATQTPGPDVPMNGRAAADYYNTLGYIPYGLHISKTATGGVGTQSCATKGNDNDCYYAASSALEYAAADASLALMAKGLGHSEDAATFAVRGQSYHNIYDKEIEAFRPRTQDGTWLRPYDKLTGEHSFHEGGSQQYQWLVPQDPQGLVSLLGGRTATTQKLDDFFAYPSLLADPAGTARNVWASGPYDYYGEATYSPTNEPNMIAPFLYSWTGRPDKTATVVRAAQTLFTNTPDGMTGNDDMGEMSAWYVMSALGINPTMSGANFYVVSTPLFPHAEVQVGTFGQSQGGTLTINAPGVSTDNRYITSASLNGQSWPRSWVSQQDIAHGGTIDYTVSSSPASWATSAAAAPPSVNSTPVDTHQLGASVTPTSVLATPTVYKPSKSRVSLTALVTSPGKTEVSVTTTAPAGWLVSPAEKTVSVKSFGLPTEVTVPVLVSAPAGTEPGSYEVSLTATLAGANPVTRTTTVQVREAGSCASQTSTTCAVDLSADYDLDGVATAAAPTEGNFDGKGYSFNAASLPAAGPATVGGVAIQAPSTTGSDPNFVRADGQAVALPGGSYSSLTVVGSSANGTTGATGRTGAVTYTDGTTETVDLQLTDWSAKAPVVGDTVALRATSRLSTTGSQNVAASLYTTTVPLNPNKSVRSLTLPGAAVPIWVAPGLGNNDWDHDSLLQVYALTLTR